MSRPGTAMNASANGGNDDIECALDERADALQRHVVQVDHRHAVEIFEARTQRDELQQVRHDLDVHAFAAGRLDQVEQLHVLFERQRDVEVVDFLVGRRSSAASLSEPSSGKPR